VQDAEHVGHAPFPVRGKTPHDRTADLHRACSERERLHDVGATTNATVEKHIDAVAHRLRHRSEYVDAFHVVNPC
jgi:hypothetical protein